MAKEGLGQVAFLAQEVLGFLQSTLQVGGGLDSTEPGANADQGIGDNRRNASEDDFRSEKLHRFYRADQTVRRFPFNLWNSREIDHYGSRTLRVNSIKQLVAQLCGAGTVDPANQGHHQQAFLRLENGCRHFLDHFLESSALGSVQKCGEQARISAELNKIGRNIDIPSFARLRAHFTRFGADGASGLQFCSYADALLHIQPDPEGDRARSEERRVGKEGRCRGWRAAEYKRSDNK